MLITDCQIETAYKYDTIYEGEESRRGYCIMLKFKIPCGNIVYEVPSTQELNQSIEAVIKLRGK
jgi:hypothetical protein